MVTNRCSPSDDSSSLVSANGSKSATSASESRTPCLMKLILAFAGSQTTFIYVLCAYPGRCQQPAMFLVMRPNVAFSCRRACGRLGPCLRLFPLNGSPLASVIGQLQRLVRRCYLSVFQMCFKIPVVILVRSDHYQLETIAAETVRKKIQLVQQIELVDKNTSQVAFLFGSYRRILYDLINFVI